MVDNWEIRNPPIQDGLGLSGRPLFSLLLPPASLLATPLCRGCSAAALASSPSSPSLNADPHVCGSCPGFSRGCSALQDKGQYPPSLGTSCHRGVKSQACTQPGLPAAPLWFPMCAGILVVQKTWGQHFHPPREPVSLWWRGGSPASCECSLAAGGWHIVYTRVCELSQTSQTRIRTELGHNQCPNIATQGFLRVRQVKQQGRTGVTVPVAFASPYLGFSAVKLLLATGPNLDFRQQNSLSQAALLLCRTGVLLCPAWCHVQCQASPSALAEPPPPPHLHCCLCCCYKNS